MTGSEDSTSSSAGPAGQGGAGLQGAVVVVTGATGNVGWGAARAFADAGARLVLPTRSATGARALEQEFAGGEHVVLEADLSTDGGADAVRQNVLDRFGRIDHVIASMGPWWQKGLIIDQPLDELREVMHTYLESHFLTARAFIPALRERADTSYTLVTGAAGLATIPGAGLLVVAAMAQYGLSRMLRAEHAADLLRINELRIFCRIEREPRSGVITAREAGDMFTALARTTISGELIEYHGPADTEEMRRHVVTS